MLAKDILVEIQAAQAEVTQLESDIRTLRKDKNWEEGIEKDERSSVKALYRILTQARHTLMVLEHTDWERPVKMKK